MVHFFRAEVQRANVWRQRLDTTTNWAVITTGATITIAFGQGGNQAVIILNLLLVTLFLSIEARRYRYYELWSYRVRLMETDFFAAMLVPPFHPSEDWAEALAENLLHPHYPISSMEAFGRRLRRNYLFIYAIIGTAWMARLWLIPDAAQSWQVVFDRAAIGTLSGQAVLIIVAAYYVVIALISLGTIGLQQSAGEVLPRYEGIAESLFGVGGEQHAEHDESYAWFRPARRRKQLLTLIITDKAQEISKNIMQEMKRGVTSIPGTGMYSGESHQILLCALTVTEIPQLKALINKEDPQAFVIVSPAQEIFGRGFIPLKK
jgi:uncharacterized membrane protein